VRLSYRYLSPFESSDQTHASSFSNLLTARLVVRESGSNEGIMPEILASFGAGIAPLWP